MIFSHKKKRFSVMLKRFFDSLLYHTKNCQGATTLPDKLTDVVKIIPYQELSGSYNVAGLGFAVPCIIPYQELSGSYNKPGDYLMPSDIIPYQELSGSYNYTVRAPA